MGIYDVVLRCSFADFIVEIYAVIAGFISLTDMIFC